MGCLTNQQEIQQAVKKLLVKLGCRKVIVLGPNRREMKFAYVVVTDQEESNRLETLGRMKREGLCYQDSMLSLSRRRRCSPNVMNALYIMATYQMNTTRGIDRMRV